MFEILSFRDLTDRENKTNQDPKVVTEWNIGQDRWHSDLVQAVHSGRLEETLASSGHVANMETVLGDVPRSWELW